MVIPIVADFIPEFDEIFNTSITFDSSPPPRTDLDPDSGIVIIEDVSPDLTATVFSPPPTMSRMFITLYVFSEGGYNY